MAEKETYFFRATDMQMVEMFLSQECAYECVKELGELVCKTFQFWSFFSVCGNPADYKTSHSDIETSSLKLSCYV